MKKFKKYEKLQSKRELPPGTAVYIGEKEKQTSAKITVINYDKGNYEEKEIDNIEDSFETLTNEKKTWINISGIHDVNTVEKIGKKIGLHPLLIEDIVNSGHRPKIEVDDNHMLVILKRLYFDIETDLLKHEQISMILTENIVITFQEIPDDDFDIIRKQLRQSVGGLRATGSDFLFYRLVDSIVDRYMIELEKMDDRVEKLEEIIIKEPSQQLIQTIYNYKSQSNLLKKIVMPVKDVIQRIQKSDFQYMTEKTRFFMHDIHDHMNDVVDQVDSARTLIAGLLDVYYSSVSYKMNEIMKVLTIVSTTFIPLTFIAGIYGMNFAHMPELQSKWGYPVIWGIMIFMTIAMFIYFKRKKWF
jgi:magnesium transporter